MCDDAVTALEASVGADIVLDVSLDPVIVLEVSPGSVLEALTDPVIVLDV